MAKYFFSDEIPACPEAWPELKYVKGSAPPVSDGFAGGAVLSGGSPPARDASSEMRLFGGCELWGAPLSTELRQPNNQMENNDCSAKKDDLIRDRPVLSLTHTSASIYLNHSSSW